MRAGLPGRSDSALDLDEKRLQTIGSAYIDENRCIAWADHIECIVCEEMCPLPEKAITLEPGAGTGIEGESMAVPLPRVKSRVVHWLWDL